MNKYIRFTLLAILSASIAGGMAFAQSKPHVYINPGHGGHDSDDRNVVVPPFEKGDTNGFWESNASLKKGFALNNSLKAKGYTTSMSRITNGTGSDLSLSTIVSLCNNSGADIFIAIHSNAVAGTNYCNYILGLYRGPTGSPIVAGSDVFANHVVNNLATNTATVWSHRHQIAGDWTYYPAWNNAGLGVLRGNNAVSMLSEGSFHDYTPETYRLLNDNYCWFEGWNLSHSIDDYYGYNDYGKGAIMGNIRDSRLLRVETYTKYGDDVRQPVNNATASLYDMDGNLIDECNTGELFNGIYVFKWVEPGQYKITVTHDEHYSQTKEVTVKANTSCYCNFDLARVRNTPPIVVSYSPVWSEGQPAIKCNAPVVFNFNWDMDPATTEAAFTIDPPVDGTFSWEDTNYRMLFTPRIAYETNTLYTVTLHAGAQHGGGMELENDVTFQFFTQDHNHLTPLAIFPQDNDEIHYKTPWIEFRADSMLVTAYYYDNIVVKDEEDNVIGYTRRNAKLNKDGDAYGYVRIPISSSLTVGKHYTMSINQELTDTAGLKLEAPILNHFVAVDAGEAKEGMRVVEEFEDATAVEATGVNATTKLTSVTDRLFGNKAVQLVYEFTDEQEAPAMNAPASAQKVAVSNDAMKQFVLTSSDEVGLHFFGDMSYNHLAVELTSTDGTDVKTVELGQITFHGWRYLKSKLTSLSSGKAYNITAITLRPNDSKMGASGTVKFDNLLASEPTGIDDVSGEGLDVKVGPIPSSDYIVASAAAAIDGVELISLGGSVVWRGAGNFVNVESLPDGVYVMKVYVGGTAVTRKVVVKH